MDVYCECVCVICVYINAYTLMCMCVRYVCECMCSSVHVCVSVCVFVLPGKLDFDFHTCQARSLPLHCVISKHDLLPPPADPDAKAQIS